MSTIILLFIIKNNIIILFHISYTYSIKFQMDENGNLDFELIEEIVPDKMKESIKNMFDKCTPEGKQQIYYHTSNDCIIKVSKTK